jgi:hypothetical protein
MIEQAVVIAHAATTLAMVGLIWFVQVVHYPLLAEVGPDRFVKYERRHVERTTLIVAPLMVVELTTAVWLALSPPDGVALWIPAVGLALLALVWGATALVQVRCHRRLGHGYDLAQIRQLASSNWIRTAAWTARGAIAFTLLEPMCR